jgi:hypothetical protein
MKQQRSMSTFDLVTGEVRAKEAAKYFAFLKRTGQWLARDGSDSPVPVLWTVEEWEAGRDLSILHDACAVRMVSSLDRRSVSFRWVKAMLSSLEEQR